MTGIWLFCSQMVLLLRIVQQVTYSADFSWELSRAQKVQDDLSSPQGLFLLFPLTIHSLAKLPRGNITRGKPSVHMLIIPLLA